MSTLLRQGSSPDGRMNIRQICPLGLLWLGFALGSLGVGFGFTLGSLCIGFGLIWDRLGLRLIRSAFALG